MTKKIAKSKSVNNSFDILVIGAGSAGLSFTYVAAQLGLNVCLVEADEMGGDCLNTGCVPSKALLAFSKRIKNIDDNKKFGINAKLSKFDFTSLSKYINNAINTIKPNDSVERYQGFGATVYKGYASFLSENSARIQTKSKDINLTFKKAIIATGASASIPNIPGLIAAKPLTNETIFKLKSQPSHLVIIGAGPIGLEMAQSFSNLGSKVTVLEVADRILINDDLEHAKILQKTLEKQGINIITSIKINSVSKTKSGFSLDFVSNNKKQKITSSHLLVAAGRSPNLDQLGLNLASVETDGRFIKVDQRLRTTNKNIFAIGDVNGISPFTHMASYQASIAIQNMLFKIPKKIESHFTPWVTYTSPEVAQVGLTMNTAKSKFGASVEEVVFPFSENDRLIAEGKNYGQIKIIVYKNRVLGASLVGDNAGEQILIWALVIKEKIKLSKIAALIAPYPTFSEVNKRVAGSYYLSSLFSNKTKQIVKLLFKF